MEAVNAVVVEWIVRAGSTFEAQRGFAVRDSVAGVVALIPWTKQGADGVLVSRASEAIFEATTLCDALNRGGARRERALRGRRP